jgi:hypothetical protein
MDFDRDHCCDHGHEPNEQELQTPLIRRKVGLVHEAGSRPKVQPNDNCDQDSFEDRRSHG